MWARLTWWWTYRRAWCLPFCHDFQPAAPPTGLRPFSTRLHRCTRCRAEGEWVEQDWMPP